MQVPNLTGYPTLKVFSLITNKHQKNLLVLLIPSVTPHREILYVYQLLTDSPTVKLSSTVRINKNRKLMLIVFDNRHTPITPQSKLKGDILAVNLNLTI